jgi:hypothetical protein
LDRLSAHRAVVIDLIYEQLPAGVAWVWDCVVVGKSTVLSRNLKEKHVK